MSLTNIKKVTPLIALFSISCNIKIRERKER